MFLNVYSANFLLTIVGISRGFLTDAAGTITNLHGQSRRSVDSSLRSPRPALARRGQGEDDQIANDIECGIEFNTYDFGPDHYACQNYGGYKYKCTASSCKISDNRSPATDFYMTCALGPGAAETDVLVSKYRAYYDKDELQVLGTGGSPAANDIWECPLSSERPQNDERPKCKICRTNNYDKQPLMRLTIGS